MYIELFRPCSPNHCLEICIIVLAVGSAAYSIRKMICCGEHLVPLKELHILGIPKPVCLGSEILNASEGKPIQCVFFFQSPSIT